MLCAIYITTLHPTSVAYGYPVVNSINPVLYMTLRNYLLLLLPMALLGCGGNDNKDDNNEPAPSAAPVLVSSNPANGATEVPLSTNQIGAHLRSARAYIGRYGAQWRDYIAR